MKRRMDIISPPPLAPAQKRFILVLIYYYSKWVVVDAFTTIKDRYVKNFLWKSIICQFNIPKKIATDNGFQFINNTFKYFCSSWRIILSLSTLRYPQSNSQAKFNNKTIISNLKKRLEAAKGRWVEELLGVLWAYRTTPRTITRESFFSLVCGMKVVIPTEIQ